MMIWPLSRVPSAFLVVGLTLIGALFRLPYLIKLGLWRDEGSTYFDAVPAQLTRVLQTVIHCELNPPGFFVIMHHWMQWFGTEEITLKLPAFVFGVLLIPAVYGLGYVAKSPLTGLAASIIATFAPDALYFSQEARPYTLTSLLCCLVLIFYLKLIQSPMQLPLVGAFIGSSVLMLYTQYTGIMLILSLIITTLWLWRQYHRFTIFTLIGSFAAILGFYSPWIPIFITHLSTGSPWVSKSPWFYRPVVFLSQVAYTMLIPSSATFFTGAVLVVALILLIQHRHQGDLRDDFNLIREASIPSPLLILGINTVLPAAMLAVLSYETYKYMLPFAPLAWVVYGHWLVELLRKVHQQGQRSDRRRGLSPKIANRHQVIVGAILAILLIIPVSHDVFLDEIAAKSGIRALVSELATHPQQKTLYLLSPDYFGPTFGYYTAHTPVPFHGFARWEHPEYFSPVGYAEIWNTPKLLSNTQRQIQLQMQQGYETLALIQAEPMMQDEGLIKFSQTNGLLGLLKTCYPLQGMSRFQGRKESVILYKFRLDSAPVQQCNALSSDVLSSEVLSKSD